ncbi:hypothetical protein AB0L82_43340 [Nocardia sp. NPDC052001]|uniref:hypothetical protein n=1 Tax=Nocardia sp. NPDC052001 TaxID=3154853 RepID=UPI003422D669
MTRKSAADLAEDLAGLGDEIRRRSGQETRAEIAREIEDRFLGRPGADRSVYAGRDPEDCLLLELTENPALTAVPELRAAHERFETEEVSDDFRAGVLFVVRLLTDPDFDY